MKIPKFTIGISLLLAALVATSINAFSGRRLRAQKGASIENLRQLRGGCYQFAMVHDGVWPTSISPDLDAYF